MPTELNSKTRRGGFTLIELLVTIVIIAILAAIAVPNYSAYVTRGKIEDATSTLSGLRVSMEQYYQDNRKYATDGECGVPVPTGTDATYFSFACEGTETTYTYTATGKSGKGMGGFEYTINEKNEKASNITAAGWTNPTEKCWATRPSGEC